MGCMNSHEFYLHINVNVNKLYFNQQLIIFALSLKLEEQIREKNPKTLKSGFQKFLKIFINSQN